MPSVRRVTGAALVAALVFSIGTQCLAGLEMTGPQMACCARMSHDCHAAVDAQDCCQTERAEIAQLAVHVQQAPSPPVPIASAVPALDRQIDDRSATRVDAAPLRGAPPPRYVLLASFLI